MCSGLVFANVRPRTDWKRVIYALYEYVDQILWVLTIVVSNRCIFPACNNKPEATCRLSTKGNRICTCGAGFYVTNQTYTKKEVELLSDAQFIGCSGTDMQGSFLTFHRNRLVLICRLRTLRHLYYGTT